MLTKLMEGLGDRLADRWIAALLTPAFVFWLEGFIMWIGKFGWVSVEQWFVHFTSPVLQVIVVVGAFLGVTLSAFVVQQFAQTTIRVFAGYWPRWFPLRLWCIRYQKSRYQHLRQRLRVLASRDHDSLTLEEREELSFVDWHLIHMPLSQDLLMPTRLGNIFQAAGLRPETKYGLDFVICWPRLWLLLPEEVKKELTEARASLNTAACIETWAFLSLLWGIVLWTWWAVPLALIILCYVYYRWMLNAAAIYGDLLDATFDLHRMDLYKSLRWPLPTTPDAERQSGKQLTQYLWRGVVEDTAYVFAATGP